MKLFAMQTTRGVIVLYSRKPRKRRTMDINRKWRIYWSCDGIPQILYCDNGANNPEMFFHLSRTIKMEAVPYEIKIKATALKK